MQEPINDTQNLPNWLTTQDDRARPFRRETQLQLLARAKQDPRVVDIIARLEEKTERYIAEHPELNPYNRSTLRDSCPEWQWVRRICRESSKVLNEMHHDANINMHDEYDILRLAAYREEHSLAHFFIEYAQKVDPKTRDKDRSGDKGAPKPPLSEEERQRYAESIRMIYPIACDLQPQVALAYAPHVMHALRPYELEAEVTAAYIDMACHYPSLVLTRPEQFDNFPKRNAIFESAQKARAERAASGTPLNRVEQTAEEHLAALEKIAQSQSPWNGSWRTRVGEAFARSTMPGTQDL